MTDAPPNRVPDDVDLLSMYRRMMLIRLTEEWLGEEQKTGSIPGPVHLYIGQEAIAAGVCAHLVAGDKITSTHRGHGHFLAKGGKPGALIAEILGRETGACQGRGGSMHVADTDLGILGANGIVGGGLGIATGAALAASIESAGRVVVAFFGDGASNQGVLSEAMNAAALWKLPLVFVCENNGFSEFSPTATVTAGRIFERAAPYGIPATEVDGNSAVAVWRAAAEAVERARDGGGPTFIEARSYRLRGHVETETGFLSRGYRSEQEVAEWAARDPIDVLEAEIWARAAAQDVDLAAIRAACATQVKVAVAFARESPPPDPTTAMSYVFAS